MPAPPDPRARFPWRRGLAWVWVPALAAALAWVAATDAVRARRVADQAALPGRAHAPDRPDAASPTGYAGGQRELMVPEADAAGFAAVEQAQAALAGGPLRPHWTQTENAPFGHAVRASLPSRAWLCALALADAAFRGCPRGLAAERAALWANPVLQLLALAAAAGLAARALGPLPAAAVAVGGAAFFPFGATCIPGAADPVGLAAALALVSAILLVSGVARGSRGLLAGAGLAGGLCLWVGVPWGLWALAGAALGGAAAATVAPAPPWRAWGWAGGATVLAACAAEFLPGHPGWRQLGSVHPLYGLAWMGAGELLAAAPRLRAPRAPWSRREALGAGVGAGVLLAAGIAVAVAGPLFLGRDVTSTRFGLGEGAPEAASTGAWLARGGAGAAAWALLLPAGAAAAAGVAGLRSAADGVRAATLVAAGAAGAAVLFAGLEPGSWAIADAAILGLCAAGLAATGSGWARGLAVAGIAAAAALGGSVMLPRPSPGLDARDSEELITRHLGHWLAQRSGSPGAVVYAPPALTPGLCFFGGLRGIGSFDPENEAGLGGALTLAAVPTMEQAEAQVRARGIRFLVLPTWDRYLDTLGRGDSPGPGSFILGEFRRWKLPPWLRPVPYQMPVGGAFEGQAVLVFEVVDEQPPAAAAARLAEYLVEMGALDAAVPVADGLRRFPGDVGALSARALVDAARGDGAAFAQVLAAIEARLAVKADRYLAWDQRVALALVLAQANRAPEARAQVERCLSEATEPRLRALSTGELFNLLVLARAFGLGLAAGPLPDQALDLLPAELRARLQ